MAKEKEMVLGISEEIGTIDLNEAKKEIESLRERLFEKRKKIEIEKHLIMAILPHRGDKLLLDKVEVNFPSKKSLPRAVGIYEITESVCKGHEWNGQKIFRGVDLIEICAQLTGVAFALKYPDFIGRAGVLRRTGIGKFSGTAFSGERVKCVLSFSDLKIRTIGGPEIKKISVMIQGKNFELFCEKPEGRKFFDQKIATVDFVEIIIQGALS